MTLLDIFRYVEMSTNEKTEYKARELKSVHVDAIGQFIKLLIHKNHVNKLNLFNQVFSCLILDEITVIGNIMLGRTTWRK